MSEPLERAQAALRRAKTLLDIVNREHTHEEMYAGARAVLYEVDTAIAVLEDAQENAS